MKDYSHIDKQKFWQDFKEKHSKHEPLELAGPLKTHDFYSASDIKDQKISNILVESAKELDISEDQVDSQNMCIHIIHDKYLKLSVERDFEQPEYYRTGKRKGAPPFKTKIVINAGKTILATKIAVQFMKKMQEKYKDCMFMYVEKSDVWRHEIMDITLDPVIFDSPKWEHIYNELGVSIHLPDEN